MTQSPRPWRDRLPAALRDPKALLSHPRLQPIAERLSDPQLWRPQHEAVARGVAVGIFWAFAIPFGQIVAAAIHCARWRASIPAAAAMTLLTNPLTIGFWLWLAYQLGGWVLGEAPDPALAPGGEGAAPGWLAEFGWPTVLGMGLFATGGAALGYAAVKLAWRARVWLKRRTRRLAA